MGIITNSLGSQRPDTYFGDTSILPEWQYRFCANYEYARESETFRQQVLNARSERAKGYNSGPVWSLRDFLAQQVPEFPDKPWQLIDSQRRIVILERIEITAAGNSSAIRDFGTPQHCFSSMQSGKCSGPLDNDAAVVLSIDFSEHDSFIIKAFSRWLKARRRELTNPERPDANQYRPRKNRRGQALNHRIWAIHLDRLGHYRKGRSQSDPASDPTLFKSSMRERQLVEAVEKTIKAFGGMRKIGFII